MALIDDIVASFSGGNDEADPLARLRALFSGLGSDDGRTVMPQKAQLPAAEASTPARAAPAQGFTDKLGNAFEILAGKDPRATQNTQAAIAALMQLSPEMSPQMARTLATNPALAQVLLPSLITTNQKPDIIEVPGQYGQVTKMVWNKRTGKLEPLESIISGQSTAAPAAPAASPTAAPAATDTTAPQQLIDSATTSGAVDRFKDFAGGSPAASSPAATVAATAPPLGSRPVATGTNANQKLAQSPDPNYVIGPAVPKPPEGYVHQIAPGGAGYLYDKATRQPVFISKAESDAAARIGEKRADERTEQSRQVEGVQSIISNARKASETPGFRDALNWANMSLDVSVPVPGTGGRLGGDVATPFEWLGRNVISPDSPKWSALQDLKSTQRSLELLVARPLMKGQGQVTDSERSMITDAIGSLGKATSVADYQFRLNQIEGMIKAMNTPGDGNVTRAAAQTSRPTTTEIGSVWDREGGMAEDRLKELASKYNVSRGDMQNYIIDLYRQSTRQAPIDQAKSAATQSLDAAKTALVNGVTAAPLAERAASAASDAGSSATQRVLDLIRSTRGDPEELARRRRGQMKLGSY